MRVDLLFVVIFCSLSGLIRNINAATNAKVICYFNGNSFLREGLGKFTLGHINAALPSCTHLVYGYAGFKFQDSKLMSLNEKLDLDDGKGLYRKITALKQDYPDLKVLLSVGGFSDTDNLKKYLSVLESGATRLSFIYGVYGFLKAYNFDGLNLAWQFPVVKPKKVRSSLNAVWHKLKGTFVAESLVDDQSEYHRDLFTSLIKEFNNYFGQDELKLSITILPNVDASLYMDVPAIIKFLDFVIVSPFDQQTADRNPKEADFVSPLYEVHGRDPATNVDAEVKFWTSHRAPLSKVVVGISTYGRTWRMVEESGVSGVPPMPADGPAPGGPILHTPGFLSWPEICAKLPTPANKDLLGEDAPLRKVVDPTKRFGSYAYRRPDLEGNPGIWVGYEDPETAALKAGYVKSKNLGGVAIFYLDYDDFRGTCGAESYPFLQAITNRLSNL